MFLQPSSANRSPALSSPLQILDGEEERGLRCRPAEEEEEEVKGDQEDCRRIGDLHSSLGSSSSSSSSSFQVNNSPCQEVITIVESTVPAVLIPSVHFIRVS